MKIAGRSGHNPYAPGASALVDETVEDRKIFLASKKYLENLNTFIDCYPGTMNGVDTELMRGINKANSSGAEVFYSVHLNKAYSSYNGAIGSEIWLHPLASQANKDRANRILKNIENLGFINRGIKYSSELAELNSTNMEAMIIECFFCEATKDVELYKRLGADTIGFAIANGIDSRVNKEEFEVDNIVIYSSDGDRAAADLLALKLLCPTVSKSVYESKKVNAKNIYVVGGTWKPTSNAILLSGNDRFATMQLVLNYKK
ncbi:N-acetylmuramoyl-L-alanine amidase [Clostridium faecium]|uniref:N-acetylmuramoyl-L-alanine amidase n=1 Tax=Clostridium faecium TaxID=2762223 RepID=A0ABR8YR58_9CLOT|nr:N-acetylmuramoyl-L-alanine amidase [Clostridium faecium]MBD8046738.1 N-acetylmuramoyl-L-alanine amidase [Clostridium faecium]